MRSKWGVLFAAIDKFCERAGIVVSLFSLVLMILIVVTVITRYALNLSFIWSFPLSRQVFGVFILFAVVYAMVTDSHLRVEILYAHLGRRFRLYSDIIDLLAFILFIGVLIWQSGWSAQNSVLNAELSQGTPKIPLYVIKSFIPVVAFVLFLEGLSFFYRTRRREVKKQAKSPLEQAPEEKAA
ncbi:MAG: transporter substrate-binding protein [Chloroflexi bacterium]|nr:transporter substrate-binding protein [Chloroflexota bacterium]